MDDFRLDGNDNVWWVSAIPGHIYALQRNGRDRVVYLGQFGGVRRAGCCAVPRHQPDAGHVALFQLEFSLQIIAAILAIIGYSLNDTIVIYDRIRENLKKYRKMEVPALLDLSVNETLARTVMTSLTLLVALLPLLLFGPASLFGMVAAITLGLFVGTYSSVYSATPILWLGVTSDSFVPRESAADEQEKKARGLV